MTPVSARYRASKLLLICGLLLIAGGAAADTVRGYVLHAQTGERLADVEVAFLVAGESGDFSEMVSRNSDAEGAFSFSGPFLRPGTPFALIARHGGLEFQTDRLELGAQDQVIVEVYDGTEDDDAIRIQSHNLFLAVTDVGIEVAQLVHINNDAAATYMGRPFGSERRVLEFHLPPGNLSLQSRSGDVRRAGPTRLFTSTPLPPGHSQLSFTAQIDGADFEGDYVHLVPYPTDRLEIFVQPATVELELPPFEDLGVVSLQNDSYRHYRVSGLSPGREVVIPLPYSQPVRWVLKWTMLGLVPVLLLVAGSLSRPVPGAERTDLESLAQRRQTLLAELAGLDDELATAAAGPAEQLRRRRQALKAEVTDLYRRLGPPAA